MPRKSNNNNNGPGDRSETQGGYDESTNMSLIDRVRGRDEESWKQFIEIYRPLIRYWIKRRGLRGDDIDDVLQDVLTSVCRSLERFSKVQEGHSFRAWLRTISNARSIDFIRKRPDEELPPRGGDDAHRALEQVSATPVQMIDDDELDDPDERKASMEVFENAIRIVKSNVEDRSWAAFWRTTVDEQPSLDVAEELGMTDVAVRKAKSRMIIRLRIELGPLLDDIFERAGIPIE